MKGDSSHVKKLQKELKKCQDAEFYLDKEKRKLIREKEIIRKKIKKEKEIMRLKDKLVKIRKEKIA